MVRAQNNIFPTESEDDIVSAVPSKKRIPTGSREGISIGGQTSESPWMTTAQAATYGKAEPKKQQGLRRVQGDQPTALWGDSFETPPTRPKTADRTLASQVRPSAQTTISDEVLNRLRDEIKKRGATGIAGLQRKFRIIDVLCLVRD